MLKPFASALSGICYNLILTTDEFQAKRVTSIFILEDYIIIQSAQSEEDRKPFAKKRQFDL